MLPEINSVREALDFAKLYILALCIWREARGEPFRGKVLVGWVIRNRVEDKRWPNTYEGVIAQHNRNRTVFQFSAFNPDDPNSTKYPATGDKPNPSENAAWLACLQAAQMVLAASIKVTHANHYHTTAVMPYWHDESKVVDRSGAHVFLEL